MGWGCLLRRSTRWSALAQENAEDAENAEVRPQDGIQHIAPGHRPGAILFYFTYGVLFDEQEGGQSA